MNLSSLSSPSVDVPEVEEPFVVATFHTGPENDFGSVPIVFNVRSKTVFILIRN